MDGHYSRRGLLACSPEGIDVKSSCNDNANDYRMKVYF